MKLTDFLKRVLSEAKAPDVDLTTLPEELPDEVVAAYEKNLLTLERAMADPDLTKTMKNRAFKDLNDGWDKDFNAFAEGLDADTAAKIKGEKFTRTKWALISDAFKKGTDDDKFKGVRKEIENLNNVVRDKDAMISQIKAEADGKLLDFKKDYMLNEKLSTLDIAEPYLPLKHMIKDELIKKLNQKSVILALENDALVPRRKSDTGELLDYYEANTRVGLDELLTKELDAFLKKSSGGSSNGDTKKKIIPTNDYPGGLTLAQINALEIKKKFASSKK